MRLGPSIRLVPDKPAAALSVQKAHEAANTAYARARSAQRALAADLVLLQLLFRPGPVTGARLQGERAEAQRQVERAQAVLDAVNDAIDGLASSLPPEQRP